MSGTCRVQEKTSTLPFKQESNPCLIQKEDKKVSAKRGLGETSSAYRQENCLLHCGEKAVRGVYMEKAIGSVYRGREGGLKPWTGKGDNLFPFY
jgi:hypothetical protein